MNQSDNRLTRIRRWLRIGVPVSILSMCKDDKGMFRTVDIDDEYHLDQWVHFNPRSFVRAYRLPYGVLDRIHERRNSR